MQLFLVVLGGRSRGCHIEQHDVRFVAGQRIEDTVPELRRQWFGLQRGLHLDSWQRIERVEGWRVELRRQPFSGPMRLWFVNVGGYDPACMAELHAFGLFVADNARSAAARAKRQLLVGAAQQHRDDVCAVEPALELDDLLRLDQLGGWHVHLLPAPPEATAADTAWRPLRPDWFGYWRLDRPQPPAEAG